MTTPRHRHGFMADLSPQAQARRARKGNSHWRKEAAADTERARMSFVNYAKRGKKK